MEEILASIKRVIADDGRVTTQVPKPLRATKLPPEPAPEQEPEPQSPAASAVPEEEDILELSDPIRDDDGITSANATVAARSSLAALAAIRQPKHFEPQQLGGDGPLEAVVKEMLRPMLKEWLDTRLPEIVEAMVAREIARITGKSF